MKPKSERKLSPLMASIFVGSRVVSPALSELTRRDLDEEPAEQIKNQRLIAYARAHGFKAYVESGDRAGVILEDPWWIPETGERGIDYRLVRNLAELRRALGY